MIYTVFPKDPAELPQDFPTWAAADDYGKGEYGPGEYEIQSTTGNCE